MPIRNLVTILLINLFFFISPSISPGQNSPLSRDLEATLAAAADNELIPVIIRLADQVDLKPYKKEKNIPHRRSTLVRALKDKKNKSQKDLLAFLKTHKVKKLKSFWIFNGMAAEVPAHLVGILAGRPEISRISLDFAITAPEATPAALGDPEWNIDMIRAPLLWDLGIDGSGIVVATMDTGVDYLHPDIGPRWRGGTNSWFDPHGEHPFTPHDLSGHGTGVMGVIIGGDAGGSAIGVAPGAQWIAVKIFDNSGTGNANMIHEGFGWLLDPDGDPNTDDAPHVVNGSWYLADTVDECNAEFSEDIAVLKTAGIAVLFSAGNSGPGVFTSVSPANDVNSVSVGAVDGFFNVAGFSGRGPSACGGANVYPTLVAPGVNIRTADLSFGGVNPDPYISVSGTSYSVPHVTGAMALLLSAKPDLTLSELEAALSLSALDLEEPGPDNSSGHGLIDLFETYQLLSGIPPETVCNDSIDNNDNGLTDCEDPACFGTTFGACDTGIPGECAAGTLTCDTTAVGPVCEQDQAAGIEGPAGNPLCTDGLDNDCDSLTDENDPNCMLQAEICDNNIDDNGDSLIDCEDPLCHGFTGQTGTCDTGLPGNCASGTVTCNNGAEVCNQDNVSQPEGPEGSPTCTDGIDNDCDGLADAADAGCGSPAPETNCDDSLDNDNNGLTDCEDPACFGTIFGACDTGIPGVCAAGTLTCDTTAVDPVCEQDQAAGAEGPAGNRSCTDIVDNDCDGLTDAADPGCFLSGEIIPPGTDIQVTPAAGIELTFAEITTGGVVTVEEIAEPSAPAGYRIVDTSFDINFTGTFSGPVTVCFAYDETGVQGSEESLKLFQRDAGGLWQDITTGIDPVNDIICGEITTFSEFTIAEPQVVSGSGGGGGCFIATAAYGSSWESHVMILREFRDAYLLTSKTGKAFVKAYYRYSPPLADSIAEHEGMKFMVRVGLAPLVGFSWLILNYGTAAAFVVLLGLLTLSVGSISLLLKHKRI